MGKTKHHFEVLSDDENYFYVTIYFQSGFMAQSRRKLLFLYDRKNNSLKCEKYSYPNRKNIFDECEPIYQNVKFPFLKFIFWISHIFHKVKIDDFYCSYKNPNRLFDTGLSDYWIFVKNGKISKNIVYNPFKGAEPQISKTMKYFIFIYDILTKEIPTEFHLRFTKIMERLIKPKVIHYELKGGEMVSQDGSVHRE